MHQKQKKVYDIKRHPQRKWLIRNVTHFAGMNLSRIEHNDVNIFECRIYHALGFFIW